MSTSARWLTRPRRKALAAASLLAVAVLVVIGLVLGTVAVVRWAWPDHECTVEASDRTVELHTTEAEKAATTVATGLRNGTPGERTVAQVAAVLEPDRPSEEDRADAGAVTDALSGRAQAALTCTHGGAEEQGPDRLTPSGLTPRAEAVRRDLEAAYGDLELGGFAPGGVRDGHMEGSAHYDGRAIDVFFRPINKANKRQGWSMAQYLVAHADRLLVRTVIFDDRIWTARRAAQGWRDYRVETSGESKQTAAILEHRDHVHVDVAD